MSGLCLSTGAATLRLALEAFTLLWTHTVEKVEWREDWRVDPGGLVLVESRVLGSGAGMEPGPDARLAAGAYRFRPALPPLSELVLARAPGLEDWRLCDARGCRPLGALVSDTEGPIRLWPCPDPRAEGSNPAGVSSSMPTSSPVAIGPGATRSTRQPGAPPSR